MEKMKTLTKQDIEELVDYLVEHLGKRGLIDGAVFFYNGKMLKVKNNVDEDYNFIVETSIEENVDPHRYTEYAAYEHILTILFDGSELYDKLNYGNGFYKFIENKFEKLGIYHEMGHSYDITFCNAYSDEEHPIEYTYYDRPKAPVNLYMYALEDAPESIQPVMKEWWDNSKKQGDEGGCVVGAYMEFEYQGEKYHMSPCSPWQGEGSWTPYIIVVEARLKEIGATNIYWHCGMLD